MRSQGFKAPMLAVALDIATKGFPVMPPGTWIAEEKFDGYRLTVLIEEHTVVDCWTRNGKSRMDLLCKELREELGKLPNGMPDGELIVPGGHSTDVADLMNRHKLEYVMFDLLETDGVDIAAKPWHVRRKELEIYSRSLGLSNRVRTTSYVSVLNREEVQSAVDTIWDRGGEGVILKDVNARYEYGKRRKTFLKVKNLDGKLTKIIGFVESDGEVMNYGKYGTAVVDDGEGNTIPVKVLDDEVRERLLKAEPVDFHPIWQRHRLTVGRRVQMMVNHPWVGRGLHIEFQERTTDGSYRHPRWNYLERE